MKKLYVGLVLSGIIGISPSAMAVTPTWGYGEVVTQMADNTQSNAVSDLIQTEENLVESTLNGLALGYDGGAVEENLKKALTPITEAVTGKYEGLLNVLGKDSSYGQIKIKKCGGNVDMVVKRIMEALALPAKQSDRNDLTTSEIQKRQSNRKNSIETASSALLSKAWIVETEAANMAEAISDTQKELEKAKSQMTVIVSILRLQEETQKSINTRLSLMGDELINNGLMVLDSGL